MTDDMQAQEALADLSRLRAIAEEGQRRPLLGGRHLVLWGGVVAVASLLHAAIVSGTMLVPPIAIAIVWFGLTGAAAVISYSKAFARTKRARPHDASNSIERSIWAVGGAFFGLITVGIFVRAFFTLQLDGDPRLFELFALMPAITFGVYAIILRASAEAAKLDQLTLYSWLSLAFVVISVILIGHIGQFFATAVGAILVPVLPGRLLLKLESDAPHG